MALRHVGIFNRRPDRARCRTFSPFPDTQFRSDRDRHGQDPGELFQLALRARLSPRQSVDRTLGSRRGEEYLWRISYSVGYNFVTSGSAGSGNPYDPARSDHVGHSREAATRSVDHQEAVGAFSRK